MFWKLCILVLLIHSHNSQHLSPVIKYNAIILSLCEKFDVLEHRRASGLP